MSQGNGRKTSTICKRSGDSWKADFSAGPSLGCFTLWEHSHTIQISEQHLMTTPECAQAKHCRTGKKGADGGLRVAS